LHLHAFYHKACRFVPEHHARRVTNSIWHTIDDAYHAGVVKNNWLQYFRLTDDIITCSGFADGFSLLSEQEKYCLLIALFLGYKIEDMDWLTWTDVTKQWKHIPEIAQDVLNYLPRRIDSHYVCWWLQHEGLAQIDNVESKFERAFHMNLDMLRPAFYSMLLSEPIFKNAEIKRKFGIGEI